MISIASTALSSVSAAGQLAGRPRHPGPPIHALLNPGLVNAQTALRPENATGSDPMALFEGILARRDADADGQLSAAEAATGRFSNLSSRIFGVIDTDGDALLSQSEMTAAAEMLSQGVNLRALARQEAAAALTGAVTGQTDAAQPPPETPPVIQTEAAAPASLAPTQAESVIQAALYEDELLLLQA